jgi:hypothetical protein
VSTARGRGLRNAMLHHTLHFAGRKAAGGCSYRTDSYIAGTGLPSNVSAPPPVIGAAAILVSPAGLEGKVRESCHQSTSHCSHLIMVALTLTILSVAGVLAQGRPTKCVYPHTSASFFLAI